MISEEHDIDFSLLSKHFTTCGDYTVDVILQELEYWRKNTDFLAIIARSDSEITGFIIGYRDRNSLWLSQVWHKQGLPIKESRDALQMAREWARQRGMTSIYAETKRNEMAALGMYGFKEFSVNVRIEL